MALKEVKGTAWQTWAIEGTPFRVERIDRAVYYIYRLWGSREVYLREIGFKSLSECEAYLVPIIENYNSSIITAVTA